ncbi:DUF6907 domain-containing protein [Streptomyces rochei]|uniref:DUF6907 domain-containing protein n=1 Tax=Streptomyces rochei TaxID=1928 RepID=UPI0036EA4508
MQNTVQGEATVYPFPAITPGHRLAPAKVGPRGHQTVVFVECPNWCTEDHVEWPERYAEDIDHRGATGATWETECLTKPHDRVMSLDAWLHSDAMASDSAMRATHVVLDDETTQAYLTPDMADRVADEIVSFASQLRQLARTARLHNAVNGSGSVADEALQRISGGAA